MLNKLQLQIEEEEIKWKSQLEAKDAEIEQIKDVRLNTVSAIYNFSLLTFIKKKSE